MIVSIVGVRPNIIKVDPDLQQEIWYSGQHHSDEMGASFFTEFGLEPPTHNFQRTKLGDMISAIQYQIMATRPDLIIVYGDANSSLAGAVAAFQEKVKLAHVEAGLRSGHPTMIEEKNRIIIDHISNFLFAPTLTALYNLEKEGIYNAKFVGDPMYDQILRHIPKKFEKEPWCLLTLHRQENVDDKTRLFAIMSALEASKLKIWFPIHPRTKKRLEEFQIKLPLNIQMFPPMTYHETLNMIAKARKVITDSGGIQKEAYFLKTPTLTLRENTEWPETVMDGWNVLLDPMDKQLASKLSKYLPIGKFSTSFGQGNAWELIRKELANAGYI